MKTIEEKAKAYDESLERAKEQLNGAKVFDYDNEQIAHDIRTTVYNIFQELKESEDEKIRKALINFYDGWGDKIWDNGIKYSEVVAWLEKQGEQKFNCDKLETFVKEWRDRYFYPDDIDKFIGFAESVIKWYQQNEQKSTEEYNIRSIGSKHAQGKLAEMIKNLNPVNEILEQNPAWSEEDEKIGKELMDFCIKCSQGHTIVNSQDDFRRWTTWLQSIKNRYTWTPSDEQMDALQYVYRNLNPPLSDKLGWNSLKTLELMFKQLKKLKE